jgi:prepilin-type N-terminal cleavage/methylation domain-containing protein
MKHLTTIRKAFTMLELVFVIIILGIVASIGAEVIAKVYESYIVQRAQYRATTKTELALNQIANRLRYAIPGTVMANNGVGGLLVPITSIANANSDRLQWVAYDGDSFEAITAASRRPGWSGFIDLDSSGNTVLVTPGSNLGLTNAIIQNLSKNAAGVVTQTIDTAVLYFPDGSSYGINAGTVESITLDAAIPSGSRIHERYKLAWSSYAVTVEGGDLYLYYNFSPITGAALGNNKSLLLKGVTNFRFKGSEGALRVKICKEEQISGAGQTVHACKEKVIF